MIELAAPRLGSDALIMAFENMGGGIEFSIEQIGWADKLTDPQRTVFVLALRGVLDMAAADRLGGRPRVEAEGPLGVGFIDLARRVTWSEWIERWSRPEDPVFEDAANPAAGSPQVLA